MVNTQQDYLNMECLLTVNLCKNMIKLLKIMKNSIKIILIELIYFTNIK